MSENLFPDDILVEILRRLPSKTLVVCTAVCKSWRSVITDSSFISLHHRHSPSFLLHYELCDQFTVPHSLKYSFYSDNPFHIHSSTFPLPSCSVIEFYNQLIQPYSLKRYSLTYHAIFTHSPTFSIASLSVVGFCNGLICITYDINCQYIIICNPSVRRFVSLPRPRHYPCCWVGFGFDSSNCDYKVVRISCVTTITDSVLSPPQVEVYSLATGFWRNCHGSVPVCVLCYDGPHGFVNGLVHWGAKRRVADGLYFFVLSFNFEDEVFSEVPLPESLAGPITRSAKVTVVEGGDGKTLTVYHQTYGPQSSVSIWVMTEYGVVASWKNVFTLNRHISILEAPSLGIKVIEVTGPPLALWVRNNRQVLLLMDVALRRTLYLLDVESKTFTDLQIEPDTPHVYSDYYSESLVLLDKANGVVSY